MIHEKKTSGMKKTIEYSDSTNSETAKKEKREKLVETTLFNFTPYKDAAIMVVFTCRSEISEGVF